MRDRNLDACYEKTHISIIASLLATVATSQGALIFSDSFENTSLTDGGYNSSWDGWTTFTGGGGLVNPPDGGQAQPLDGNNAAYIGGGAFRITITNGWEMSDFSIVFDHWNQNSSDTTPIDIRLIDAGGMWWASVTPTLETGSNGTAPGVFKTSASFNFTVDPGAPTSGDMMLEFSGQGTGQWYLDNIRLSATPVPEPSVALLGGLGLLAVLRRKRR